MSTKLSKKLERINTSVSKIRQKANMPDAVIEDLAVAVESMVTPEGSITITENSTVDVSNYAEAIVNVVGGGATKSNIYKVDSIAERDAITDMVEGDMCVVYNTNIVNLEEGELLKNIYFPETIVMSEAITSSSSISWGIINNIFFRDSVEVMASKTSCRIRGGIAGMTTYATYTSTDGITYTRTSTREEYIPDSPIPFERMSGTDGTKFTFTKKTTFMIYTYINNAWEFLDIGKDAVSDDILEGMDAYTNHGSITGTLGTSEVTQRNTIKALQKTQKALVGSKFTGDLDLILQDAWIKTYTITDDEGVPALHLPEIDCSEVTSIANGSKGYCYRYDITKNSDTQPYYRFHIKSCEGLKNLGAGFVDTTETSNVNIIYQGLTHYMDDESLLKLFKNLGSVKATAYAGISLTARVYKVLRDNNLLDEVRNKGWKFYICTWNGYVEVTDFTPNTISEALTYINGHITSFGFISGLIFDESILSQTISLSVNQVWGECRNDPFNEYLPHIKLTLDNSLTSPYYQAQEMFDRCISVKKIGGITISSNNSNKKTYTNMSAMYQDCWNLEELPTFDTTNITDASDAFKNCRKITSVPSSYNFTKATAVGGMFFGCTSLVDMPNVSFPVATNASQLFRYCENLKNIPSTFSLPKATTVNYIIDGCKNLTPASIYNVLNAIDPSIIQESHKKLSVIGLTLEQWNSLSASQQNAALAKGFINDLV